ncbi:MAG: 30S ribosomal protein S16, partial [Actinomycetota bacterium]|nr:30S ribosomal protein S16 [Actinomycetota bacterium]
MAVKIRLKRMGKIRTPHYRIVVTDARSKRDGRVIEEIGLYNPKADPSVISVDADRAQYWLGVGAQPTEPVAVLLKLTGDWQRFKGEAAPVPLRVPEPKRDKTELFNEALRSAQAEPTSSATTRRKSGRTGPTEEPATADAAAAGQSPAAGQSAAEEAAAGQSPA